MDKRGISAVVATILIVLITVAAVTIVWTIVIPMIKNQASFENELVNLDIETVEGYTVYDLSTGRTTVQVSRGNDETNLIGVQFIFSKNGNSQVYISSEIPEANQKKTYKFNLSIFGEPDSISIAGVFENDNVGSVNSKIISLPDGDLSNVRGIFVNPWAGECIEESVAKGNCGDTLDNDCDGLIDLNDTSCYPGLIAWWRFDDGTASDEMETYNGTLFGNTDCGREGKNGLGCYFDGSGDYISFPTEGLPYSKSERTMCLWSKVESVTTAYHWAVAYGTPSCGGAFFIGRYTGTLFGGGYCYDVTYSNYWIAGPWNHVCLTYNGTTATLYSNGYYLTNKLVAWNTKESVAYIGRQTNNGEYWNGHTDEIMIFDRALNSSEIWEIYDFLNGD